MMWCDSKPSQGGAGSVSIGSSPANLAGPNPGRAVRATPGGAACQGSSPQGAGAARLDLRLPWLAYLETSPRPARRTLRPDMRRPGAVAPTTGPARHRHAGDRHPGSQRLERPQSLATPSVGRPASGSRRLGRRRRPGPRGHDSGPSSSRRALGRRQCRSHIVAPRAGRWAISCAGHPITDAEPVPHAHSQTGGCHAQVHAAERDIPERSAVGTTRSNGDAARSNDPEYRLLHQHRVPVRTRARPRHIGCGR